MENKINWKNVFFSLEEEKTLEERLASKKIAILIVIIFLGFLIIFPLDKMIVKTYTDENDYTAYGTIIKLLLMIYPVYYYRKINKAMSLALKELKDPTLEPLEKSEIVKKYPELGKNLGLKGFFYALAFLVLIMLFIIFWR